jgi:peptide methionine sulfoxide reductase msrA/msrB
MNNMTFQPVYGVLAAVAVVALALGIYGSRPVRGAAPAGAQTANVERNEMVRVRVIGPDGELTDPVEMPRVALSDAEWQERLTPEQYKILRNKGTEPAFCGLLLDNKKQGYYVCLGCNLPLFSSKAKFDSGTGWPSFFQPVAAENIREEADRSYGMVRTEILCARCDGHLGHVFRDGPRPTGLRYCLNSESMRFVEQADAKTFAETVPTVNAKNPATELSETLPKPAKDLPLAGESREAKAVLANGCFWCTEAVFELVPGVKDVVSGYSGGDPKRADYKSVTTGTTGHAEAVEITYDPSKVTYGDLLRIFFATHDPTTKDRQGPDRGTQYRSAIFYANDEEKQIAQAYIKQLSDAKAFDKPIVTTLEPLNQFHVAEEYHQDFMRNQPNHPYIQTWAVPKVKKLKQLMSE